MREVVAQRDRPVFLDSIGKDGTGATLRKRRGAGDPTADHILTCLVVLFLIAMLTLWAECSVGLPHI